MTCTSADAVAALHGPWRHIFGPVVRTFPIGVPRLHGKNVAILKDLDSTSRLDRTARTRQSTGHTQTILQRVPALSSHVTTSKRYGPAVYVRRALHATRSFRTELKFAVSSEAIASWGRGLA